MCKVIIFYLKLVHSDGVFILYNIRFCDVCHDKQHEIISCCLIIEANYLSSRLCNQSNTFIRKVKETFMKKLFSNSGS